MATSPYPLADFIEDVQSTYSPSKPETFSACGPALTRLLLSGAVEQSFKEQLRNLSSNPGRIGDWESKEVFLHRSSAWSISVALFDAPRRYVHVLPFLAIYAPLGTSKLIADRYRLPEGYRNDVFDPTLRLEPAGAVAAGPREVLRLETDQFAYDFNISQPTAVLRFATAALRPLEWLFTKGTLQAWQANDAESGLTQLRVATYVLGKIAHQSSIVPLRSLSSHPHHAVRWAAIQNLGRLSRSEALIKIREAVNDPHPHVRRAAQKTLEQLDRRTSR